MANIAKLPDGVTIAVSQPAGTVVAYGPHCTTGTSILSGTERYAVLHRKDGLVLATVTEGGDIPLVKLDHFDPITVPYVNRFLAGTGKVIIKDWRTGDYRTKVRRGAKGKVARPNPPKVADIVALAEASATAFNTPATPVVSEGKGAVITVSADEVSTAKAHSIPGMVTLPKATLKGAGRGHSDMGGIIIPNGDLETLTDAWSIRQDGDPAAVLLTGPAGTAKTQLVRAFAAYLGVPYLKVDAGAIRTADDWAGAFRQDPNTKTWAHQWSPFAQAVRLGVPCILHVDELTRTESPAALNAFMGLLDETGTLSVPDANTVLTMPKGILVVATANIGPEFVGTLPLDGAVRQRFPYGVRMTFPAEAAEAKLLVGRTGVSADIAMALVRMAVQQRLHREDAQQYPSGAIISTRVLLSIAKRIAKGRDPRTCVLAGLNAQFDPGDDAALSVVVDSQFPKGAKFTAPSGESNPATIVAERHWFVGMGACDYEFPQGSAASGSICGRANTDAIHFGAK